MVSATTIRCTCFGVAPPARSSASSRRRCRTDRLTVADTTSAITTITMPPKMLASRISGRKVASTPANSAPPRSLPVRIARSGGSAAARSATAVPGAGKTPTASIAPGSGAHRAASASRTNSAGPATGPATIPASVNARGAPATVRVTVAPGRTPSRAADRSSSTTSPLPGSPPLTSAYGASSADAQPCPLTGAPSRTAGNDTSGTARATPGTAAMAASRAAPTRDRSAYGTVSDSSSGSAKPIGPVTTIGAPAYRCGGASSRNAVSNSPPQAIRSAQPSSTERNVATNAAMRNRSPASAILIIGSPPRCRARPGGPRRPRPTAARAASRSARRRGTARCPRAPPRPGRG